MDAQKQRNKALIFFAASVALHLFFLIGLRVMPGHPPSALPEPITIDLTAPLASPVEEKKSNALEKAQIVESEQDILHSDVPDRAKYLSDKNQKVAEETKAKNVDTFRTGAKESRAGNNGKSFGLKDLAPSRKILPPTSEEIASYQEKVRPQPSQDSGQVGQAALDSKGAATNDYLKDVKDGDRTMLSTKEFVYFGYYRRIRQRLEIAWNSRLRSTLNEYVFGGRQLASNKDYVTGVIVVLDSRGNITRVQVKQGSGARDLDQAAIDAFNQAGPFPDPPAGLVDDKGEIEIPWNFILQS